ncbi:MAG: HAD family phosphatase [Clostridia bacterium]|nr:HAD family phosphatase [Clostridia bacterium]
MIKAVLFDMDGTLLDTESIYRPCWTEAFEKAGVSIDVDRFFVNVSGMNMPTMKAFCAREYGEAFPFEEIRNTRREILEARIERDGVPCKRGVPEILFTLQKMGIRMAVASSSGGNWVRKCLRLAGVDEALFECIMTGERVEKSKPDPEIFLKTAAILGVDPAECVVAEDSANGVRAGVAAGMRTVMIPDLQPCTDDLRAILWHCIDSLEALPALIEKHNLESENKA